MVATFFMAMAIVTDCNLQCHHCWDYIATAKKKREHNTHSLSHTHTHFRFYVNFVIFIFLLRFLLFQPSYIHSNTNTVNNGINQRLRTCSLLVFQATTTTTTKKWPMRSNFCAQYASIRFYSLHRLHTHIGLCDEKKITIEMAEC